MSRRWLIGLVAGGLLPGTLLAQPGRNARLDSLEALLPAQPRPDTVRLKTLNELIWENRTSNPRRSLALAAEALQLGRQLGFRRGLAKTYVLRGIIYAETGRYPAALADFEACRRQRAALRDWQGVAGTINDMGEVLMMSGNYPQAIAQFLRALRLEEKYGTPERIAADWSNIGTVYQQMGRPAQALRYHQRYLRLPGRVPDAHNTGQAMLMVAQDFLALAKPDSAAGYLQRAMHIGQQAHDRKTEAQAQAGLGTLALKRQAYAVAARHARRALELARHIDDGVTEANAYNTLAAVALQEQQFAQATSLFTQARNLGRRMQAREVVRVALAGLAVALAGEGNPEAAYQTQQQLLALKDSILTEASARQIEELRVRYQTERQVTQNRLQAAQLRAQQQLLARRNAQLVGIAAVSLLLGLVGWLLYNRQRLRAQVARQQEHRQLEQQRAQAVLEAEEKERRRIGSDLHDGIGQLLTAAKLNLHALEQRGPRSEEQAGLLHNAIELVNESFVEVRTISHNLMPNALLQRGLGAAVQELATRLGTSAQAPQIVVQVMGLENTVGREVENVLFRVIQELLQNVLKHAQARHVTLQLLANAQELTVVVEDDGVGFNPQQLAPERGIGLRNVHTRLAYVGGQAHFDSTPGRGTTVTLEVPLRPRRSNQPAPPLARSA